MLGAALALPLVSGLAHLAYPMRTLTGIPCPLCGMTTSVIATVHLRLVDALAANPAGIVAVVVAILVLVRRPATVSVPPWLAGVGLVSSWLFQLHRFGLL